MKSEIKWNEVKESKKPYTDTEAEREMMENGYDGKFAEKFSGLAISNAADTIRSSNANNNHQNDSSLFQVMKAVEAAEATIKQQVEENLRLRTELQHKILELDRYVSPAPLIFHSFLQQFPSIIIIYDNIQNCWYILLGCEACFSTLILLTAVNFIYLFIVGGLVGVVL